MADDAGNIEYISLLAGRPPTTPGLFARDCCFSCAAFLQIFLLVMTRHILHDVILLLFCCLGGAVKLPTFADVLVPQFALRSSTFVLSLGEVIVFTVTLFVGGLVYDGVIVAGNDMYGPSTQTLKAMGGKWEPDIRNNNALWRLVTPIFLHAGFLHIFSNLFFQLRLGFILERRWTMPLFLLTYVLTGIGSSLMSCVMSPDSVSVGASGALFGLLGAVLGWLALNYPSLPVGAVKSEAIMVIVIAGINFLIGTTGSIDNWAHLVYLLGLSVVLRCVPVIVSRVLMF